MAFGLSLAILVLCAVVLALMLGLIVKRAFDERVARRRRESRAQLEPRVDAVAAGREAPRSVVSSVSGRDTEMIEELVLERLADAPEEARPALRELFRACGGSRRSLEALSSRAWWERAAAAERLGRAGDRGALPALIGAMRDEEAEVRFRAAKALGDLGGREAIGSLVEALDEPSRWSSIRIADILADMGGGVAREIVDHYDTLSPAARPLVLDILARREAGELREWIRERAADDDRDVRARACHALGVVGDARGDGTLLRERVRDAEWPVRALAAKSLGRLGVREAVPELADALRDREWWVRANAAEALRALGEPGLAQLEEMVDDDDVYASHQAVLMLQLEGRLDERLEELAGTDEEKRRRGETILRSLVELGQTSYLRELAAQHRLPAVRDSIERALTAAAGSREATP